MPADTTTILLTVGTSLMEPKRDPASSTNKISGTDLVYPIPTIPSEREFIDDSSAGRDTNNWEGRYASIGGTAVEALGRLPPEIVGNIRKTVNPDRIRTKQKLAEDPFPAEISTVVLTLSRLTGQKIRVGLLASDTVKGLWCAIAVRHILRVWASKNFSISDQLRKATWIGGATDIRAGFVDGIHQIPDLDVLKPADFVTKALPRIAEIVRELAEGQDTSLILDVTGGFKSLLPYAGVLGAIFENVTVQSLFESSAEHVIQPPLPLQLDLPLWTMHRASLAALKEVVRSPARREPAAWATLPAPLQGLFRQPADWSTQPLQAGPLLTIIEKRASDLQDQGGLSLHQPPAFVRPLFRDPAKAKALLDWVDAAGEIWLGDLIPETVDHARGHAHRLWERAFELIRPIQQVATQEQYEAIFPDDVLLMLFGTLWVHDVGHASHRIRLQTDQANGPEPRDISAFPSLVRDLHSFTACERILDDPRHFRLPEQLSVLGVPFSQAVALGYRLHRGSLSVGGLLRDALLNHDQLKPGVKRCWGWVPDVERGICDPVWKANWTDRDAAKFAVALQRMFDGSDVRSERAGNRDYRERRLALTWDELRVEWERLKRLRAALKTSKEAREPWVEGEHWIEIHGQLPLEGDDALPVSRPLNARDLRKAMPKLEAAIYEELETLWKADDPLFFEYLSAFDRVLFKYVQASHFTEVHARVLSTSIREARAFTENESTFAFEINMEFASDTTRERANQLAADVWGEYNPEVRSILKARHIEFVGVRCHGGEFEDFLHTNGGQP